MNTTFRPQLVNKDIVYCLIERCPQAKNCLRYLAYSHSAPFNVATFVDPRRLQTQEPCPHYLSPAIQRIARGFKHGVSQLPYGSIRSFQGQVRYALDCERSQYYRYFSGETPLYEAEQEAIRSIFAEFGVSEGELFDSYDEAYELPY